jgi:hypothetical protein
MIGYTAQFFYLRPFAPRRLKDQRGVWEKPPANPFHDGAERHALKERVMSEHGESKSRREAFEAAALEHFDLLYNMAMVFTRNSAEAQDLVQETYCAAYRFFHRFQPGTNMKAWLVTILRHININPTTSPEPTPLTYSFA